ncbi:MAG TPA: CapA family protein [Armatimonadetes bacterium]|nr:CapA family protein [Armatimonadota bacterium]
MPSSIKYEHEWSPLNAIALLLKSVICCATLLALSMWVILKGSLASSRERSGASRTEGNSITEAFHNRCAVHGSLRKANSSLDHAQLTALRFQPMPLQMSAGLNILRLLHLPFPLRIPEPSFTLFAAGDIMLGRGVGRLILKHGADYPFKSMQNIIASADIAFGNLESPITPRGRLVAKNNRMIFSAPPKAVNGLVNAGFDVLSLANNHATNFGLQALYDTIATLNEHGIAYVGAGRNFEEAHQPALLDANGITVAFLAYNEVPGVMRATNSHGGVAWADVKQAQRDVRAVRPYADVVIVSMHMGREYVSFPHGFYRKNAVIEFAHAVIDAGADIVLGHHPHTPQGIEYYRGKLIAYSLGNFVFDQREPWCYSIALWLEVSKSGVIRDMIVIPIYIDRCQPRIVSGWRYQRIRKRMERISWTPLKFWEQPKQATSTAIPLRAQCAPIDTMPKLTQPRGAPRAR